MKRNVLVNSDIPNVTYELPLCVSLINAVQDSTKGKYIWF